MSRSVMVVCGLLLACANGVDAAEIGLSTGGGSYWTNGTAREARIAVSGRGDILVAWESTSADGFKDIYVEASPAGGHGEQSLANTTVAGDQHSAALAIDAVGNGVVVWQSGSTIFGQRISRTGAHVGGEFRVSDPGSAADGLPDVAMDAFGNFIVVWKRTDAAGTGLRGKRYLADGTELSEFQVIGYPSDGVLATASLAVGAWGDFAIAWDGGPTETQRDIFARSYAADGTPDAEPFAVAALPAQARREPGLGMDAFGRFAIAWQSLGLDGLASLQSRQFLAGGAPVGPEAAVNQVTDILWQSAPSLAMGPLGDFVVAWSTTTGGWAKQQFARGGERAGPEVGEVYGRPQVAIDADGDAYVAHEDAAGAGTIGYTRYAGPEDVDLSISIKDLTGRIAPGDPYRYRLTVRNRHPGSKTIGIAALDAAVGIADASARGYLEGPIDSASVPAGCQSFGSPVEWWCHFGTLAPGASVVVDGDVTASQPGMLQLTSNVFAGQYDSNSGNDVAQEMVTVDCPANSTPGSVAIAAAPDSAVEGETITLELMRSGGTCGAAEVGVAMAGSGIVASASWAVGAEGARIVAITVPQDDVFEESETMDLALTVLRGAVTLGTPSTANIAVLNDDVPCERGASQFAVNTSTIFVAEGDATTIEIDRVGGNCGAVSLSYWTSYGPDNPRSSGTLDWGSGEAGVKVAIVATTEDNIDEYDQPVQFTAATPDGALLQASIVIVDDDDEPTITVTPVHADVVEGTGGAAEINFTLSLSNPSEKNAAIPFTLSGTADNYDYFVAQSTGRVVFYYQHQPLTIHYRTDSMDEDDETIFITMGQPTHATWSGPSVIRVDLRDDDSAPSVRIITQDLSGPEGSTHYPALIFSNMSQSPITVPLNWGGTAANGVDYTGAPSSITVPPYQSNPVVIPINITRDGLDEETEVATLTLGQPTNATLGSDVDFALTIEDGDAPPLISFKQTWQSVREGDGTVQVVAELSQASGREIRVVIEHDGTATSPADFSSPGELVIPAGSTTGVLSVNLNNDVLIEQTEGVEFVMYEPTNVYIDGAHQRHTVLIEDNDPEILGVREKLEGAGVPGS